MVVNVNRDKELNPDGLKGKRNEAVIMGEVGVKGIWGLFHSCQQQCGCWGGTV